MELTDYFQKIYIINLPERIDRRTEMATQLSSIGLSFENPKVHLFPATKPTEAGEFTSIGARGCFHSHLAVLKDAKSLGLNRILILEDDLNFSENFSQRLHNLLESLAKKNWDIFYFGYLIEEKGYAIEEQIDIADNQSIIEISPNINVMLTHFISFQNEAINQLPDYLELLVSRKKGDPRGGPMHVDGAYSWFRKSNPSLKTLIAEPELGYQRSSKSDISSPSKFKSIKYLLSKIIKLK